MCIFKKKGLYKYMNIYIIYICKYMYKSFKKNFQGNSISIPKGL